MQKYNITPEQSIQENLDTWCFEVGSRFEQSSVDAVKEFANIALFKSVCDIGAGDGASTKVLDELGFEVTAVDINLEKLLKIKNFNKKIIIKCMPAIKFLKETNSISNFFSHHSLEHMIDAEEIIKLAGQKLKIGGLYYVTVPAGDYLHSVHHVVFENAEELLPKGLTPVVLEERERFGEKEFLCIAQKRI